MDSREGISKQVPWTACIVAQSKNDQATGLRCLSMSGVVVVIQWLRSVFVSMLRRSKWGTISPQRYGALA